MNKQEAVKSFVEREFNSIPLSLIEKAYSGEEGLGVVELIVLPEEPTPEDFGLDDENQPSFEEEDIVREDFETDKEYNEAVNEYDKEKETYEKELKKWEEYQDAHREWESEMEDYYPMWGTIFEASSSWVADSILENIKKVQEIGFIVIDGFDELNVCLGVNGAGYDFYEAHWTPLYDVLGLKWHNEE